MTDGGDSVFLLDSESLDELVLESDELLLERDDVLDEEELEEDERAVDFFNWLFFFAPDVSSISVSEDDSDRFGLYSRSSSDAGEKSRNRSFSVDE